MRTAFTTLQGWFDRNRRETAVLLAICMLLSLPWFIGRNETVGAAAAARDLPIYNVKRDDKCVSLTFDAAWGNEDTQQLIDTLKKYNVNATFFVVGAWVDKYPESVKALADAGNEVMSHSNDHAHFNSLTSDQITANVTAGNEKIEKVTGKKPTLFRCPYGEYDNHVITTVKSMGITPIQWNVDSLDWKGIDAQQITGRVMKNVVPGSIILFHNAAKHTPEALPGIIEQLLSQGYKIVPVSQLILQGDYKIDNAGMQYLP